MRPTDLQLQLALAKVLPELISIGYNQFNWKENTDEGFIMGGKVTPREWDWVVRECEKKLDIHHEDCHWFFKRDAIAKESGEEPFLLSWQQRAIAYFKTIGKEIE